MDICIFIKTYCNDFYKIQNMIINLDYFIIEKNTPIIIITDDDDNQNYNDIFCKLKYIKPKLIYVKMPKIKEKLNSGLGYNWQQIIKLEAYKYFDCDYYIILDTDMLFLKQFSIFEYFNNNIPIMYYRKLISNKWIVGLDEIFPNETYYDTMPIHHFVLSKDCLVSLNKIIQQKYGNYLNFFIKFGKNTTVSEFYVYYNYILLFFKNKYNILLWDDYSKLVWWDRKFIQTPSIISKEIFTSESLYILKGNYLVQDFTYRLSSFTHIKGNRFYPNLYYPIFINTKTGNNNNKNNFINKIKNKYTNNKIFIFDDDNKKNKDFYYYVLSIINEKYNKFPESLFIKFIMLNLNFNNFDIDLNELFDTKYFERPHDKYSDNHKYEILKNKSAICCYQKKILIELCDLIKNCGDDKIDDIISNIFQ